MFKSSRMVNGLSALVAIMSGVKVRSSSVCPSTWQWTVGAAVGVSVAWVMARRYWSKWKLDQKLAQKRERCRQTLRQIEHQLKESPQPARERDAIVSLPLSALQAKLQSGELKAETVLRAYQEKGGGGIVEEGGGGYQAKLQSGELKAETVLRAYQEKALEVNSRINCIVEAIPEAQELAAACDQTGDKKRLLHGVPISLKENIGVKGYDTTAGLQVNIGNPCEEDSVVVEVFKRHGAIPFVRTNIPQAMLSYACSNPIFGVTQNPHNLNHCPGGSSGGEGAILGGGASIMGLGSDVGGSIRVPAGFCGVYGFKPTLGRFSKQGVYSVTKGRLLIAGVVGPMGRDVDTLVLMTRVMASPDMRQLDPSLPPLPFNDQVFKSTAKLRIGYYTWDGNLPPVPVVCRAVREAKAALESLGHTLVEFTPPDCGETVRLFGGGVLGGDQGQTLRNAVKDDYLDVGLKLFVYLSKYPRWLLCLLARIVRYKEPVLKKMLLSLSDGTAFAWFAFAEEILRYRKRFMAQWRQQRLDAVICPIFCSPPPRTEHIGKLTVAGSTSMLFNLVNFPSGVVPVTKVTAQDVADVNNPGLFPARTPMERFLKKSCDREESVGLPVAVQCATLPYTEEVCLRLMKEMEGALHYTTL
ncbi:hypothetical protein ACOMHN_004079 [Nucella lapillus]